MVATEGAAAMSTSKRSAARPVSTNWLVGASSKLAGEGAAREEAKAAKEGKT